MYLLLRTLTISAPTQRSNKCLRSAAEAPRLRLLLPSGSRSDLLQTSPAPRVHARRSNQPKGARRLSHGRTNPEKRVPQRESESNQCISEAETEPLLDGWERRSRPPSGDLSVSVQTAAVTSLLLTSYCRILIKSATALMVNLIHFTNWSFNESLPKVNRIIWVMYPESAK